MMEYEAPLAGSAGDPPKPQAQEVREVHPVVLDKDIPDYRGLVDKDFSLNPPEAASVPKVSPVQESVSTLRLPTGMEDVSKEDLDNLSVPPIAEKDTSPPS